MPLHVAPDRLPTATYRIQLRGESDPPVDFTAVQRALPGLAELGASHLYLSPVLRARAGSAHGYDVADPTEVDPALGGEEGLRALARDCRQHGLGLILDIVPNHQATSPDNPRWWDLLAHGREGASAAWFDVDWDAPGLPDARDQVILPVLGAPLGEVLAAGELVADDHELRAHGDHRLPLAPDTPRGEGWAALLSAQHHRACHWRVGDAVVNYRRFFAIDDLAAVRIERPEVRDEVLGTVVRLVAEGVADGLRIDHIDGLADPAGLCADLRARLPGAWLVAEKILEPGEALPDWPLEGATGYDFLGEVLGLFVDPDAEEALTALAREVGAWPQDPGAARREAKREVTAADLAADRDRVARALWRRAATDLAAADVTLDQCRAAVTEVVAHLPVYRAYAVPGRGCDAQARQRLERAVAAAAQAVPHVPAALWALLEASLRGDLDDPLAAEVCVRGQQLSGAATAKGVEDTDLYRQHRLVALNEVGVDPTRFGWTAEALHAANRERARRHPAGMLTTATHDTKRGEDVRLRVAALTEVADAWSGLVRRWRAEHASLVTATPAGPAPAPSDQHVAYQTLVGVWAPAPARATTDALATRVGDAIVKGAREAGQRTTWTDPDAAYEAALRRFVTALLDDAEVRADLDALAATAGEIAQVASLAQTLLRATSPGVPDTYQGTEGWEDHLVDPDNRRPVDLDLAARERAAADAADAADLLAGRADGRIKRRVLTRALRARRAQPGCVGPEGAYEPLAVGGRLADHVVAFARRAPDGQALLVVAPRLPGAVMRAAATTEVVTRLGIAPLRPPVGDDWAGTDLALPADLAGVAWHDVLADREVAPGQRLPLPQVLGALPVALLVPA